LGSFWCGSFWAGFWGPYWAVLVRRPFRRHLPQIPPSAEAFRESSETVLFTFGGFRTAFERSWRPGGLRLGFGWRGGVSGIRAFEGRSATRKRETVSSAGSGLGLRGQRSSLGKVRAGRRNVRGTGVVFGIGVRLLRRDTGGHATGFVLFRRDSPAGRGDHGLGGGQVHARPFGVRRPSPGR